MSGVSGKPMTRGVRLTVVGVIAFILVIVAGFVYRIQQPRILTVSEMRANGLYLLDTPRELGDFALVDHRDEPFVPARLEGHWSLVFFGFTHCPDICPTTMAFLDRLAGELEGTEAEDTAVFLVSVDPARDTPAQLASYVPYFNPDFTGVTGEFLDLFNFRYQAEFAVPQGPGAG